MRPHVATSLHFYPNSEVRSVIAYLLSQTYRRAETTLQLIQEGCLHSFSAGGHWLNRKGTGLSAFSSAAATSQLSCIDQAAQLHLISSAITTSQLSCSTSCSNESACLLRCSNCLLWSCIKIVSVTTISVIFTTLSGTGQNAVFALGTLSGNVIVLSAVFVLWWQEQCGQTKHRRGVTTKFRI